MTVEAVYTLEDAIEEALEATASGTTPEVVRWLRLNRRSVLDQNAWTIEHVGLSELVRVQRKKKHRPSERQERSLYQLCLDLGVDEMELDTEISIPENMEEVLYGPCRWVDLQEDATADDVAKHIVFLEQTAAATIAKADNFRVLHQAMIRAGSGRTDIPMKELRGRQSQ